MKIILEKHTAIKVDIYVFIFIFILRIYWNAHSIVLDTKKNLLAIGDDTTF